MKAKRTQVQTNEDILFTIVRWS